MNEDRESFRKIGLTFEEKAFYDILIALRDQYNFEYGTDRNTGGVIVNDKCRDLAKKIKEIIPLRRGFAPDPKVFRILFYQGSDAVWVLTNYPALNAKGAVPARHHSPAKPHVLLGSLLSVALPST